VTGPVVYVVLPGDVDDAAVPSGGNTYDRHLCDGLVALGWSVRRAAVPGSWPRPDDTARVALAESLGEVPDGAVVLMDGLVACGVPDIVVPQASRLRVVVLVHMPLADETSLPPALADDLDARERQTLLAAAAVVATSPSAARRLVEHHGLAAERVHSAVPGTDPAPITPGADGVSRLLCVAAVTHGKGQDLLVTALAAVADLPWTCELVGSVQRDPAYVAQVGQLIEQHGLGERIRLTGPLTGTALADVYAGADLLVLASRTETYGMVVTEALARGIPVLTTTAGALPDTLGNAPDGAAPGMLVPPDDPSTFADALRRWFGEPDLRQRLRSAALLRRDVLDDWLGTAKDVAAVLDQVTGAVT
jgi:glycosyltransferase involved in cell wall biosynthesis